MILFFGCFDFYQDILQLKEVGNCTEDLCKMLSFRLVKRSWWILVGMIVSCTLSGFYFKFWRKPKQKLVQLEPVQQQRQQLLQLRQQQVTQSPPKAAGKWRKKLLMVFVLAGMLASIWLFWHLNGKIILRREVTLANMCDERARMLQDQFNVSMNHVNALAILVSTFHHGKNPSAIDQVIFSSFCFCLVY